jgi:plastocyanin
MTPIRRTSPLVATATAVLALAGCGSSSHKTSTTTKSATVPAAATAAAATPAVATAKVAIKMYAFSPATVHVKVGGKITFTNFDSTAHTATSDDGTSFDSGTLDQGHSKTITFTKAGTFTYHCAFHAFMTGTVVVS